MTDENGEQSVVFETPWHQRAWGWASVAIVFFFAALLIPGVMWSALAISGVWRSPPWWWHLVGLAIFAFGIAVAVRHSRKALTRKLVVGEKGWHLQGLRNGPLMSYENVKLLQLEDDRHSTGIGKTRKLVIELRGGDVRSIWLRDHDARECLDAMHQLCGQAIAINPEGETWLPVDERMHAMAHAALAQRYTRRGWLAVAGAIALLLFSVLRGWIWFSGTNSSPSIASLLIRSAIQLGVITWLVILAARWFRLARMHIRSIAHPPPVDEVDDDDDRDDD